MTTPKQNYVIGIDLGTTQTCVAVVRNGLNRIIQNEQGNFTTPSIVSFMENQILVGDAAETYLYRNIENTIYDSKRIIGRDYYDEIVQQDKQYWKFKIEEDEKSKKPKYIIKIGNKIDKYLPEEISTRILQKVKKISSDYNGQEAKDAVITVPAHFNNAQRTATKEAAITAGFKNIRIINEPTAAAIAYGLENLSKEERKVLVFDLGGGTFDVSILKIKGKKFEVLTSCGDSHLGGEDFTIRLTEYLLNQFNEENNTNIDFLKPEYAKQFYKLKKKAEKAKKELSSSMEAIIDIDSLYDNKNFFLTLTRGQFNAICDDIFPKCITLVKKALKDINLKKEEINEIVLAGGTSRIPKIQNMIENFFSKKDLKKTINPDQAIATGAAIIGNMKDNNIIEIVDVTNYSIGVEDHEGKMQIILPRGTFIPQKNKTSSFAKYFIPKHDYINQYTVKIYEGDHIYVKDNHLLEKFSVIVDKKKKKEEIIIKIKIEIDSDSIITVTAMTNDIKREPPIRIEKARLYTEEDMKTFRQHAQEYIKKENDRIKIIEAKDKIFNLNNQLRESMTSRGSGSKLSNEDLKNIKNINTKTDKWLHESFDSSLEECNTKINELSQSINQYNKKK